MSTRRWRDPRDGRSWEVTVSRVDRFGRPGAGPGGRPDATAGTRPATVSFDLLATPKRGFATPCCARSERRFPRMPDQELALCLDAARRGGRIWVDPRSEELWWVQAYGGSLRNGSAGAGASPVVFQSVRSAVGAHVEARRGLAELSDSELASILDAGEAL